MEESHFEIDAKQLLQVNSVKPSFWLLHSLGWAAYVLIFAFDNILFYQNEAVKNGVHIIVPLFLSGLIAWLCTLPLRQIYRRCWNLSPLILALTIITASIAVAGVWTPVKNVVMWQLANGYDVFAWLSGVVDDKYSRLALFSSISYSFFIVMVWSSLYFGINYHFRLVSEKEQHLQAVWLSHNAQIKMLRYQINPHFLFNTLNAISTLVLRGDKEKANGMLNRLSTFLRFSLDNDPEQKIRLYEELKALMLYLEIEKTRFDDRLSVTFKVDPRTESCLVPSLLLQPLVENSIKYAIAKMSKGGRIEISASYQHKMLHLEVADNGPNSEELTEQYAEPERKGLGLSNIRERLNVLYPQAHHFEVTKRATKGFRVIIEIPVEES